MRLPTFLLPTRAKMLLALALFVLFVPSFNMGFWIPCPPAGECPLSFNLVQAIPLSLAALSALIAQSDGTGWSMEPLYLNIAVGLPILYLFSCVLIWAASKKKK